MTTRINLSVIKQIPESQASKDSKHEYPFWHRKSQTPWQNWSGTWVRGPHISCPPHPRPKRGTLGDLLRKQNREWWGGCFFWHLAFTKMANEEYSFVFSHVTVLASRERGLTERLETLRMECQWLWLFTQAEFDRINVLSRTSQSCPL